MSFSSKPDYEKNITITMQNTSPQSGSESVGQRSVQQVYSDDEYITLGPHTYRREDLLNALQQRPYNHINDSHESRPNFQPKLANPVPLGLACFSLSCTVLSLVNARIRGVTNDKFNIGLYLFFGGVIELFAGLLCFIVGNTYAMVVFSSFGGFWISWGCINTNQIHGLSGYDGNTKMFDNITGFFLAGWTVFTFLLLLCTLKSTWGLFLLLFFLDLTFLMLCIGSFINNTHVKVAGGYFGIFSSVCGWYSPYCMVVNEDNPYLNMNAKMMPHAPTE